eukprot:m.50162 g.50162  ORF g.50162 m.50162 type:complete len:50 (-) comp13397_c0_seq1:509-658(-)
MYTVLTHTGCHGTLPDNLIASTRPYTTFASFKPSGACPLTYLTLTLLTQ